MEQTNKQTVDTAKAKTVTNKKANQDWANRWREYQDKVRQNGATLTTAQGSKWTVNQHYIYKGLLKAESTVVTLLRTEQIGLGDYLCTRKVPGYKSPLCECGWPRQM